MTDSIAIMQDRLPDMTATDDADAALLADGRRFRLLLEQLDTLFWSVDQALAGQLYQGTDERRHWDFAGNTEHPGSSTPGARWPGQLHGDDRAILARAFASLGDRNGDGQRLEVFSVEYRLLLDSGEIRWIRDRGIAVSNADGLIDHVIGIAEDITGQRGTNKRLQESERDFKTLAENAPDVIARIDRDLRYLYLNRAAEMAFGVQRSDYLGRRASEVGFPSDYVEATTPMFGAVLTSAREHSIAFDTMRANERRYFIARAVPELDRGGALESLLLIVYDVSEQVRLQNQRDQLLASEHAAREQAERATRSRDEFLAIVSHELRSPLNGIQNWTEVLLTTLGDSNPLAQRALAGIRIGIEQQVRMIDDLLDATRIITGELSLSLGPVLLRPVLIAALASVRGKAEDKAIELIADIRLETETIEGDSDRIQQVIWNLLSNAIKFTPRGGHVWLKAVRSRGQVKICVRDDGRGIDADFMPQLFERFQRDETGNSLGQDGFGLGLMLVRHLCELHRGNVSARSEGRGQGVTFTVRLPLSEPISETMLEPIVEPGQTSLPVASRA
ncbi:ATP-binding protein [uncultured Nevskia sp.]|uniref:sensor histidine kinase n=1 Tax=uncultured Nevskia sp. TaxID=228950 RepID=UPI0025DEA14F|nr:ATP-binding protein [uncultured Nevskia sp.]